VARAAEEGSAPKITCFYTRSGFPEACAAMLRTPQPKVGWEFDLSFGEEFAAAARINASLRDGALMVGRRSAAQGYRVSGWSFRLYPPPHSGACEPNRGAGFNSCLAMSSVESVDRVYLVTGDAVVRLERGRVHSVLPLRPPSGSAAYE
jgi:hypothetical protein